MAAADGDDQVVNARNAGREVLDCFFDLADTSSEKRNAAVATLIAEIKKQDNQDRLLAYVFNRILKGLGSGRGAARQGFAAALTALLENIDAKDTADILKLAEQHLSLTGAKGADEKNVLLGQLFFHASLLQARRLDSVASAQESITALFQIAKKRSFLYEACTSTVLDVLDGLPSDAAAQLIDSHADIQALISCSLEDATPEALMVALHLWPLLSETSRKACKLLPEGTAQPSRDLFQQSSAQQHTSTNGKAVSSTVPVHKKADQKSAADFFTAKNLQAISHILKDASFVRHQLHSVWLHVLRLLIPSFIMKGHKGATESSPQSAKQQELGQGHLAALWATVIESGLLFSPSLERKAVALQLFCILLPHIAAADVPIVFSTPFVRLLGSSLKGKEQSLHKGAVRCIDRLADWAQTAHKNSSQDPRPAVLFALSAHGHAGCDGIVKVKAVTRLSNSVDVAALEQYVQRLLPAFWRGRLVLEGTGADEEDADDGAQDDDAKERVAQSTRVWVIGQLGIIAKSPACTSAVAETVLQFLSTVAFAEAGPDAHASAVEHVRGLGGCRVPLSEAVRSLAASRTAAIATDALPCARAAAAGDGAEAPPANGAAKHAAKKPKALICLLHKVLEYLDTLEGLPSATVSLLGPDDTSPVVRQRLKAMMAACDRGRGGGRQDAAAAHMHMLLGMLRLTLCTSAAHDAAELIVDLYPAVGPILGADLPAIDEAAGGDDSDDAMEEGGDAAGQGTGWVNQLTECLLSLLSDSLGNVPMAVMRVAAEGVWRAAAPHVNAVALSDLLQVLLRLDQKAVAEEAMFEGEDDADEDDDDEDDEEEDEEEDGSDEEDESGGEGGGGKLAQGGAEVATEGEAGQEDSEDEGLDDAAMFRLDKQLAKYFSTLKGGKEGVKLRNEALRKFQLRVLSLIEIWAKKEPASPLAALVPVPLLRALRIASRPSGHPPLAQRLEHVLKHQVARCRPVFAPSLAVEGLAAAEEAEEGGTAGKTGLEQVMSRVMYFATRESDEKVLKAATAAYTMLLRGLIAAAQRGAEDGGATAGENPAQVALHAAVAAITEEVFDKRKSRWSYENVAGMLTAAQGALPVLLLPALLEKVVKPRTEFLRIEALRLCAVCLRVAPRQLQEFQALKIEGKTVKAVTEVVAAGYTNDARRLSGLHACADALEGLCKLHTDAAMGEFCPEKRLNALRVAIKQVQGIDDLPAKCKTQLQRVQKVLDRQRGDVGSGKRKRKGDGAAVQAPAKPAAKASKTGKKAVKS